MKKLIATILCILMILTMSGCAQKSGEEKFHGTVVEDYETYCVVEPDENEAVRKIADRIFVTKDVLLTDGVPELEIGQGVRILYQGKIRETDRGVEPEIVCAVYTDEQLKEWKEE